MKQLELTVVGAKLTGAVRYGDVLSIGDAGADFIFRFGRCRIAIHRSAYPLHHPLRFRPLRVVGVCQAVKRKPDIMSGEVIGLE